MIRSITQWGQAFRVLVGVFPYGTDQSSSQNFDRPSPLRRTYTFANVHKGFRDAPETVKVGRIGLVNDTFTKQTGGITVVDNDFSDPVEVFLGNYRFLAHVDFVVGVGVDDTAHNLATLISKMPEFSATAVGPDVEILFDGGPAEITLKVLCHGGVENLTITPFTKGSPCEQAPLLT